MPGHPQVTAPDAEARKDEPGSSPVDTEAPVTSAPEQPSDDIEKASPAGDKAASSNAGSESGEPPDPDAETAELLKGWRVSVSEPSLCELNSSVKMPGADSKWYAKMWAFAGMGFIISVGYMDPGNWATDITAGSSSGYVLLVAVLLASITAMFLQALSLKLGVATERDLAQACRTAYRPWINVCLWIIMEVAITATDLAEIIGSATAMYLLFGLPLWVGVLITAADVLFILFFGTHNFRLLELLVFALVALVAGIFTYELAAVDANWAKVMSGFIPRTRILTEPGLLYTAIGILGATVMPHNLFLHSAIVQTRNYPRTSAGKRTAIKFGTYDSNFSLCFAFFVNAAILIVAGAAFFYGPSGGKNVAYISDAYHLIAPAVGSKAAKILFGLALLAAGQNATITGTLAGQVVMEGMVQIRLKPWLRRAVTRCVAIIPAAIVAGVGGNAAAGKLLVLSQVVISLTLIFATVPLVHFTSDKAKMGEFVNGRIVTVIAWTLALIIGGLNTYLVIDSIRTNQFGATAGV